MKGFVVVLVCWKFWGEGGFCDGIGDIFVKCALTDGNQLLKLDNYMRKLIQIYKSHDVIPSVTYFQYADQRGIL